MYGTFPPAGLDPDEELEFPGHLVGSDIG